MKGRWVLQTETYDHLPEQMAERIFAGYTVGRPIAVTPHSPLSAEGGGVALIGEDNSPR